MPLSGVFRPAPPPRAASAIAAHSATRCHRVWEGSGSRWLGGDPEWAVDLDEQVGLEEYFHILLVNFLFCLPHLIWDHRMDIQSRGKSIIQFKKVRAKSQSLKSKVKSQLHSETWIRTQLSHYKKCNGRSSEYYKIVLHIYIFTLLPSCSLILQHSPTCGLMLFHL